MSAPLGSARERKVMAVVAVAIVALLALYALALARLSAAAPGGGCAPTPAARDGVPQKKA